MSAAENLAEAVIRLFKTQFRLVRKRPFLQLGQRVLPQISVLKRNAEERLRAIDESGSA
jgi:hypothetical protein